MNFALLGDHPDGLDMARAVAASGRHRLLYYCGPASGEGYLRRWEVACQRTGDLEEVLAHPAVDAVIVASGPGDRPEQARRALQAERHVLCVHPLAPSPDPAYEAAIVQKDTGRVLLPLLPETVHPALAQLAQLIARDRARRDVSVGQPGSPRLLQMERWATETILLGVEAPEQKPGFPGWEVLRCLAGEIVEVSAFAQTEEAGPGDPILLAGCFERGGLFQVLLVPDQPETRWRLTVLLHDDQAELLFPEGWPGPARLRWREEQGDWREQTWEAWNPWPRLLEIFEAAVALPPVRLAQPDTAILVQGTTTSAVSVAPLPPAPTGNGPLPPVNEAAPNGSVPAANEAAPPSDSGPLTWLDEVRCLELDDAARRSLERRRSSTLEYQEAIEEASFKGTMTLAGCALLWASLFLLICSAWVPYLGWLIVPLCAIFLGLQLLRWLIPPRHGSPPAATQCPGAIRQHGPREPRA